MARKEVVLGCGCFWYLQHLLEPAPGQPAFGGIIATEVGYAGRTNEEIELEACGCSSNEAVKVFYDESAADASGPAADALACRLQDGWQTAGGDTFRRILWVFWMCQEHHKPGSRFTDGYQVKLVVDGDEQRAAAEESRAAFEHDLREHLQSDAISLSHVEVVDGSRGRSSYTRAEERQQHWFHKGSLAEGTAGKDGQTALSARAGLGGGLGGSPLTTPKALNAWVVGAGAASRNVASQTQLITLFHYTNSNVFELIRESGFVKASVWQAAYLNGGFGR